MADGGAGAPPAGGAIRTAVVGMSTNRICGVHDHATLLARALEAEQLPCSIHWLTREQQSLGGARTEVRRWTGTLAGELARERAQAVLLHYSVFSYSYRGLPLFVRPTLSALRAAGIPVIGFLHEFVYPWDLGGLRGKAWAVSQRAAMIDVMRACAAAVVTIDERADWLTSRVWLPRRPVAVAPVFSNLPAPSPARDGTPRSPVIGVFGYSYEGAARALILDAVRVLAGRGVRVELRLLGAPGSASAQAQAWLDGARERGLKDALSFSGTLPAQEMSDALAACEMLLFADAAGPTSRKGSLAASLASGRPVLALDGPSTWRDLVAADAIRVVDPAPDALAGAVEALLDDEPAREALGARGRGFAEDTMGVKRSALLITEILDRVLAGA